MTLHAPHTSGRACALIARRLLLGRSTVMAVCFTAFASAVVTSSHSNYDVAGEPVMPEGPDQKIAAHGIAPVMPTQLSGLAIIASAPAIPDTTGKTQQTDPESLLRAAVEAEHPKFETWPLPDSMLTGEFTEEIAPTAQPEATVQVASLVPPSTLSDMGDDALYPRMPETASLAIVPSDLGGSRVRDHVIDIDTDGGAPEKATGMTVESIHAVGGETIAHLLDEFDIHSDDKLGTLVSLRADSIPETLSTDDRVDLAFEYHAELEANDLLGIRLRFEADKGNDEREVELIWTSDVTDLWASLDIEPPVEAAAYRPVTTSEALDGHFLGRIEPERVFVQGMIGTSLYAAADDAGMTPGEATTLTDIFRYLIDFERDIRVGDRFEVMFDKKENGDYGDIVYAMIENRGEQITLYRAETANGSFEYFDGDGKTNKRALMRTPLAYARISSKYGMRRHPIDGYRKMHRGVDFSAARGTPIVAAGSGVVDYVGRRGGYGKYIRLRHNGKYKTAYAHLSKYAAGMSVGKRVKQGEVIGFVGSTGRSTGPHLHFEVLENGKQINPMEVGDFGAIRSLAGADLARFKAGIARINLVLSELRSKALVAEAR